MAVWLQVILGVAVVLVVAFLVPLLMQARQTAAAVQRLAESAREDLDSIAADVRHVRLRVDGVADLAVESLKVPATISALFGGFGTGLLGRQGLPWLEAIVTGVEFAINWFKRRRETAPPKEAPHE